MINCKKIFSCLCAALLVLFCGMFVTGDAYAQIQRTGLNGEVSYGPFALPSGGTVMGSDHAFYTPVSGNTQTQDGDGIFSSLVNTGRTIFNDLRELIYIVAGFGIIAVGVGGIFGNLNWKWLGAIIISLVIIATAGELVKQMLGDAHGIINESDDVTTSMQE